MIYTHFYTELHIRCYTVASREEYSVRRQTTLTNLKKCKMETGCYVENFEQALQSTLPQFMHALTPSLEKWKISICTQ